MLRRLIPHARTYCLISSCTAARGPSKASFHSRPPSTTNTGVLNTVPPPRPSHSTATKASTILLTALSASALTFLCLNPPTILFDVFNPEPEPPLVDPRYGDFGDAIKALQSELDPQGQGDKVSVDADDLMGHGLYVGAIALTLYFTDQNKHKTDDSWFFPPGLHTMAISIFSPRVNELPTPIPFPKHTLSAHPILIMLPGFLLSSSMQKVPRTSLGS